MKFKAWTLNDSYEKEQKLNLTGRAIEILDNGLKAVSAKQRSEAAFSAQANWYEHREEYNKFFLNVNNLYRQSTIYSLLTRNTF